VGAARKEWTVTASASVEHYNTNPELARAYAEKLGWSVTNLAHATKVPRGGTHGWKDGTSSVEEIEARWAEHPTDDPAIVPCLSDLVVTDFDRRNGGYGVKQKIEAVFGPEIFNTAKVSTHDGEHFYWDVSGGTRGLEREIDKIAGLDLRGPMEWMPKGYVVAPRAGHPDADQSFSYEWATGLPWDFQPKPFPIELAGFLAGYAANQPHIQPRSEKARTEAKRERSVEDESEYLDANEVWARQVCDLLGIPFAPGKAFHSPLREDRHASCSIVRGRDGGFRYHDFAEGKNYYYGLPQVYGGWLLDLGHPLPQLGPVEYRLWQSRASLHTGWADEPAPIAMPPLPPHAPGAVPIVAEAFRQALRCHALYRGGVVPIPFSYSFAARWCGVTEAQAEAAVRWLVRGGLLVKTGESKPKRGRVMGLWLPSNYAQESLVAK
jgi:hypothetical protein